MTRIILVTSGKGGVGKTTLVSNLSSALAGLGQDVIAMDANLTTPNLGLHLGLQLAPRTLHDVLRGDVSIRESTYPHPLGFRIIPGSMSVNDLTGVDPSRLSDITTNLRGQGDFVIADCAAGLGREAITAMQSAEEILLITNPDLPSVVDGLKMINLAERSDKKILGVIVNRIGKKRHELTRYEIESMLDHPVVAEIPEDKNISKAIAYKLPVVDYDPYSPASIEIKRLACWLTGREFKYKTNRFRLLMRKLKGLLS